MAAVEGPSARGMPGLVVRVCPSRGGEPLGVALLQRPLFPRFWGPSSSPEGLGERALEGSLWEPPARGGQRVAVCGGWRRQERTLGLEAVCACSCRTGRPVFPLRRLTTPDGVLPQKGAPGAERGPLSRAGPRQALGRRALRPAQRLSLGSYGW